MKHLLSVLFIASAILTSAPTVRALDSALRCEATKLKVAGKYGLCRLKAEGRAVRTGAAPDYNQCDTYFASKWALAESRAGSRVCASEGDQMILQAFISYHANVIATAVAGFPLLKRFIDNHDGTIRDNWTGLIWEKKTELDASANFANPHDADNTYYWAGVCELNSTKLCQPTSAAAALCVAHAEGTTIGCDECTGDDGICSILPFYGPPTVPMTDTIWTLAVALNDASFGGATNWRIPTLQELSGIVDYSDTTPPLVDVAFHGTSCGPACADITNPACSCTATPFSTYWCSTPYGLEGMQAGDGIGVDFSDGNSYAGVSKGLSTRVRAVRSGV